MSYALNVVADQVDTESDTSPDYAEETAEATEEVNTNDPTAAAISASAGWEFYNWHEDKIAPGETRLRQFWGKTNPNDNHTYAAPLALQPILVYQLKDRWYISNGESPIAYNWQNKEWLVPLGIRLGRTIKDRRGGIWNAYAEYRTNVVYEDWQGAAASDIFRISASYTFAN